MRMIVELPDSLESYMERASEKGEMTVNTEDVLALDIPSPDIIPHREWIWLIMPSIWKNI